MPLLWWNMPGIIQSKILYISVNYSRLRYQLSDTRDRVRKREVIIGNLWGRNLKNAFLSIIWWWKLLLNFATNIAQRISRWDYIFWIKLTKFLTFSCHYYCIPIILLQIDMLYLLISIISTEMINIDRRYHLFIYFLLLWL